MQTPVQMTDASQKTDGQHAKHNSRDPQTKHWATICQDTALLDMLIQNDSSVPVPLRIETVTPVLHGAELPLQHLQSSMAVGELSLQRHHPSISEKLLDSRHCRHSGFAAATGLSLCTNRHLSGFDSFPQQFIRLKNQKPR